MTIDLGRNPLAECPAKTLCIWCLNEIPEKRLAIVPGTKRCVACQTLIDEPAEVKQEVLVAYAKLDVHGE